MVASRSLFRTLCARRLSRAAIREEPIHHIEDCASCNGSSTRTRPTRRTWLTSRSCSATKKARPAWCTIATFRVCFRARDGCNCYAKWDSGPSWSKTMKFETYSSDIARRSLGMGPSARSFLDSWRDNGQASVAFRDAKMRIPIDRSGPVRVSQWSESEAAHGCHHRGDPAMSGSPFRGMHWDPPKLKHHRVRNRVKEVHHHGR